MEKIKKYFRYCVSVIIAILAFIVPLYFFSSFSLSVTDTKFQYFSIVILWSMSVIVTNGYLVYTLLKKKIADTPSLFTVLLIFNNVILISSLIPLFVYGETVRESGVKNVISNIYIFYYFSVGLMVAGLIVTLLLIKKSIKKSNWWIFIASIPYIITGWIIQQEYMGFNEFVNADNFSYENVANMLRDVDGDMLLLNPTWYKFLAIPVIILIFMMGMILVEFIWKKTSSWRKGVQR